MLLSAGLFASLLAALMLFFVPAHQYDVSPAAATMESTRKTVENWLVSGRGTMLKTIKKSSREIVKTGVLTGIFLALLAFILTVAFIGPFALLASIPAFFAGVALTRKVVEKEYRRWQNTLNEGVPQLVNFMPAFLEVEGVIPREAIAYTIPFLPETLKREMWYVLDRIKRTARVKEALDELAAKTDDPVVHAVCFRLSANWDASISADIFSDLTDDVEHMNERAVTRATVAMSGFLALICVLGLIGMLLIFGFPGYKYLMSQLTGGFGM